MLCGCLNAKVTGMLRRSMFPPAAYATSSVAEGKVSVQIIASRSADSAKIHAVCDVKARRLALKVVQLRFVGACTGAHTGE